MRDALTCSRPAAHPRCWGIPIRPTGEYTIRVFAVQADGIGYFAGTKQVTVGDIPAAPTGLSASVVCGHEINLAWTWP